MPISITNLKRCLGGFFFLPLFCFSQTKLENNYWKLITNSGGQITSLSTKDNGNWSDIPVQADTLKGLSFYYSQNNKTREELIQQVKLKPNGADSYKGYLNEVELSLQYTLEADQLVLTAKATNHGHTIFEPQKLGLNMGISNYMTGYPQWNNVYFPTMLRCEKTHFTGYLMTPTGKILVVASPDPIASYSLNYNYGYGAKDDYFFGHRIYTFNLDLINPRPLPERNPQQLSGIAAGETKTWRIRFKNAASLEEVQNILATLTGAPTFNIPQTTVEENSRINFSINGNVKQLTVQMPGGRKMPVAFKNNTQKILSVNYTPSDGDGVYTFYAASPEGKMSEAKISVRKPWSWYLQKARLASIKYTQKASYNSENWYGFYSAYLAQQYFPDSILNKKTDDRFALAMSLLYDTAKNYLPIQNVRRIQNHSTTIGILTDKYKVEKNIKDLKNAASLADWIIMHAQSADGAYRNGKVHYTSVVYIAKSIMELMVEEKKLAAQDTLWANAYARHYTSVKRAIDQLTEGMGGIDTEGELTFEDGMISCTALQLEAFALLQPDEASRKKYQDVAMHFINSHQCLTQLVVPDSRMRGGTLRFWEAQYDVLLGSNMMSSPHGWSGWKIYATWYAYLLTGEEKYLLQTMNALGSCVQLVDFKTGDLRWAFINDPYINTIQQTSYPGANPDIFNDNQYSPYDNHGIKKDIIVGEQYINMVADKYNANTSDNDVHEIFKAMEEAVLTSAYILKRKNGSLLTYNCTVAVNNGEYIITPAEGTVTKIHCNGFASDKIKIGWKGRKETNAMIKNRLEWVEEHNL
jgi:hypothetical protein